MCFWSHFTIPGGAKSNPSGYWDLILVSFCLPWGGKIKSQWLLGSVFCATLPPGKPQSNPSGYWDLILASFCFPGGGQNHTPVPAVIRSSPHFALPGVQNQAPLGAGICFCSFFALPGGPKSNPSGYWDSILVSFRLPWSAKTKYQWLLGSDFCFILHSLGGHKQIQVATRI